MFSAKDVMDVFHARALHEDCKRLCESLRIPYYEIEPASSLNALAIQYSRGDFASYHNVSLH